ncbi:retrotransposon protein, putative, ty1-copia subclass, partial [Tanacetum coccineum]
GCEIEGTHDELLNESLLEAATKEKEVCLFDDLAQGLLDKQKRPDPTLIDWYRPLRIVLSIEDKFNYLEQPLPPAPVAPAGVKNSVCPASKAGASSDLSEISRLLKQEEGKSVTRNMRVCAEYNMHSLGKTGYIDNLERLGHPVTLGLAASLILIGLRKGFDGFVQNYNMHSLGKTVNELHAMLKLHEQTLNLPKNNAPALHAIQAGKVQKGKKHKKRQPQMAARGQNQGNEKNKHAYAPKPKIPPPPKREDPAKDSICHECGETRHWKRSCPQYLAELLKKKKNATSGTGGSGVFTIELNTFLNRSWIYDTGCGTHICNTTQGLRASRKLKPGALSLYVGNGQREAVEAIGNFDLSLPSGLVIVLNNCHYAPSITRGVISVSRLYEDGFINRFVNNTIQVSRNNMVYFSAIPRDGIFEIDLSNSYTNENSIYTVSNKRAKLDLDSALLWHCRLGHISKKRIEKLQHDGLLNSTDLRAFEKCVPCMSGKMARKPYTHQVERAKDLLGLIHTDVCGPFKITSRQGASYFVTFTDDFSRYGYVYLLKHKHEVFETFKVFQKEVENQLGKTIKSLRSDRGGEYMSQEFLDHLKDHGIIAHRTPPYTPQHNGVSERRNRTLLDMVRSMMSQTTLPKSFWDYALETAARILNMVPTKKVEKTPYEVWHGQAPKLSYLKVWGCEALVKRDTLTKPDKLEPRSIKCIFIGYPKETMGYSFYYPPENKVLVARNAEFLENSLINQEASGSLEDLEIIQEEDTHPSIDTSLNHEEDDLEMGMKPQQVISFPIRRILIAIAAYYDYEIWKMDVKTAFLNGYLNEEVYMEQPEARSRQWNKRFDDEIKKFGFTQNADEPIIPMLQDVKSYLGKCFAMKDLGEAAYILGIKIYRDRSRRLIGLCQSAYIEKILKRFHMENSKRGSIPMQDKLRLSKSQVSQEINKECLLVFRGDLKSEHRVFLAYIDAGYQTDADDLIVSTWYACSVLNGGAVDGLECQAKHLRYFHLAEKLSIIVPLMLLNEAYGLEISSGLAHGVLLSLSKKLYGMVVTYYENHLVAGAGLMLWGDLQVLMDSQEGGKGSFVWNHQSLWQIRSWRLYTLPNVHVLETVSGEVLYMFVDVSYPLSVKLMERMLKHKLEIDKDVVGNDMTTAEQLIWFIKNQIAAAQVSPV